jgi:hypothetical protein
MPTTGVLTDGLPAQTIASGQTEKSGGPDNAAQGEEKHERDDIRQHHGLIHPIQPVPVEIRQAAGGTRHLTKWITRSTIPIKDRIHAISVATAAIPARPRAAATSPTVKKTNA